MIHIGPHIAIGEDEIEFRFVRASGPGGQNVNKVASAVQLRFDAVNSPALDAATRARLARIAGRRMTADGVVIIDARRHRTQERNRADALERLIEMLRQAAVAPKPRRPMRPRPGDKERRLATKHHRGGLKRMRRVVDGED